MPHKRITPRDEAHANKLKWHYAWVDRNKDKPEYKQKRRERQRNWTRNNPKYRQEWRRKIRAQALAFLGDSCSSTECKWENADGSVGCRDLRCLQIDHVNGGGRQEFLTLGGGDRLYQKVVSSKGIGYQLLCANCNWIKRHLKQEWPSLKVREAPSL